MDRLIIHGLGPLMDDASSMRFLPRQNLISQELWVSFVRWWLARRCGCAMGRVGVDLGVLAYAVMAVLAAMHKAISQASPYPSLT